MPRILVPSLPSCPACSPATACRTPSIGTCRAGQRSPTAAGLGRPCAGRCRGRAGDGIEPWRDTPNANTNRGRSIGQQESAGEAVERRGGTGQKKARPRQKGERISGTVRAMKRQFQPGPGKRRWSPHIPPNRVSWRDPPPGKMLARRCRLRSWDALISINRCAGRPYSASPMPGCDGAASRANDGIGGVSYIANRTTKCATAQTQKMNETICNRVICLGV